MVVLNLDITEIKAVAFKFAGDDESIYTDCNGSIGVETETRTKTKTCAGATLKELTKPTKMTISLTAFIPIEIFRRVYGIKQDEKIKAGVYSYGKGSSGEQFSLMAELYDEWQDESKLIAFLKASTSNAFQFTVDASEDEVAQVELEATAYEDDLGYWYHEAIASELPPELTKEQWLTALDAEKLKKSQA